MKKKERWKNERKEKKRKISQNRLTEEAKISVVELTMSSNNERVEIEL
jgi:DNA-binding protein YbaB